MKKWVSITVIVMASVACAQMTPEEARKRMAELNREAATRPAYDRPVREIEPEKPQMETVHLRHWRLKEDAPDSVRVWFAMQPAYRQAAANALQKRLADAEARVAKLERDLDEAENRPIPYKKRSSTLPGGVSASRSVRDMDAVRQRKRDIAQIQQRLIAADQEVANLANAVREFERQTDWLHIPAVSSSELAVGMMGQSAAMRVSQVLGDTEALCEIAGQTVWVTGFDFSNVVDGERLAYDGIVHVSGIRSYTTVLGASRKVLVVEPIPLYDYLEEYFVQEVREVEEPIEPKRRRF